MKSFSRLLLKKKKPQFFHPMNPMAKNNYKNIWSLLELSVKHNILSLKTDKNKTRNASIEIMVRPAKRKHNEETYSLKYRELVDFLEDPFDCTNPLDVANDYIKNTQRLIDMLT